MAKKILIVDDSEAMMQYIIPILESADLEVVGARSFVEGLEKFNKFSPDAVLADFFLGDNQTGLQLITALHAARQDNPGGTSDGSGSKSPISFAILTTGQLSEPDAKRASDVGAILIQKPVHGHSDEFLDRILLWLKNS